MSKLDYEVKRAGNAAQGFGNAVFDSFKNYRANWKSAGETAEAFVEKAPSRWTAVPRASARAAMWIVEQPLAWAVKPITWTLKAGAGFYTKFPRFAPVATVIGGAVAVGSYFTRRNSAKIADQYETQMAAMQAQAAGMQPSYKNSASQADVDAGLAAGRAAQGQTSHLAAVEAARAQVPTPEGRVSAL